MQNPITFKRVGPQNAGDVLPILQQSPQYYKRVSGIDDITIETARNELTDTPPKKSSTYEKMSLLVLNGESPIGFIDLHINHPEAGITYIGLLLLTEAQHGKGLGSACYNALERWVSVHIHSHTLRLGVSTDNPVEPFWTKMGFSRNGRNYIWSGEQKENTVYELEKKLARS